MKLAFCLFNYFPYGGLQRDFLRIAKACRDRGHEIHVYTMSWDGELEVDFRLHLLKTQGWQNHARCSSFAKQLYEALQTEHYDLVIGFNKMAHLDLYYAADVCYQARVEEKRSTLSLIRLLPRYRQWVNMENAVFARGNKTKILLISAKQEAEYTRYYHTEPERFYLLPPGIAKDRIAPDNAADIRQAVRDLHQLSEKHFLLLMVGSGFKTKGLDRTIRSLASLPSNLLARCRLMVIGRDNPKKFIKLARKFKIANHIQFLGGRSDVPDFLLAADLLLHPSYHENTGTVLLEAVASGLPVLTVDACGYAPYIREAKAGLVLPSPFCQAEWNTTLKAMLLSPDREQWKQNGLAYAKKQDIYSLPEKAADVIDTGKI